jgi:Dolichyl-phosphate-mannose-protein mannosyltransferase
VTTDVAAARPLVVPERTTDEPVAHLAPAGPPARRLRLDPRSALLLTGALALVGAVHAIGTHGAPGLVDDEGTYVAQAWAVLTRGTLSHYTYWYDHPPLGWIQVAGWSALVGGFHQALAVARARDFMVVASVVGAALLYVLARRLGFARVSAAGAVLLFGLSPLAVAEQRLVLLDNLAVVWLLGALVLAASPARRLWAFAASGACLAVAVLTKETFLLVAPAVVWLVCQRVDARTRRFCLTAFTTTFVLGVSLYPLFAALKGELVPSAHRVSLVDGIRFQLLDRPGSGSVFDATSAAHHTVTGWLHLDPWLVLVGVALIPAAFAVRRLRAFAVGLAVLAGIVLLHGYLPGPFVIAALPLAALVIAGVADTLWTTTPATGEDHRLPPRRRIAAGRLVVLLALVVASGLVAPHWASSDETLMTTDQLAPVRASEYWLAQHLSHHATLIVDDTLWVDLVEHGFAPTHVVWYQKLDFTQNIDPSVTRRFPQGWRNFDDIVSTPVLRTNLAAFPTGMRDVRTALAHSRVLARFGFGANAVEVRAVDHAGRS